MRHGKYLLFFVIYCSVTPVPLFVFFYFQLFESESSTYTYLLADQKTKDAILIDPVLETIERDLKLINELGVNLKVAGIQLPVTRLRDRFQKFRKLLKISVPIFAVLKCKPFVCLFTYVFTAHYPVSYNVEVGSRILLPTFWNSQLLEKQVHIYILCAYMKPYIYQDHELGQARLIDHFTLLVLGYSCQKDPQGWAMWLKSIS